MTIKRRRGRHLPVEQSIRLLVRAGGVPGVLINGAMGMAEYELQPTTRPYLRSDGRVTVRLVWRHRETRASLVYSTVLNIADFVGGAR